MSSGSLGARVRAGPELDTEPAPPDVEGGSGAGQVGTLLADRYRVDKLLGEGGMGQVFLAEHVHMKKAVAIKVLHRELTLQPEIVARFEREAVAAARIEHPNVAAATDFGRLPDGAFYLVLEFVEGQSLTELLAEQGRLPAERALAIARQIGDALSAAHAAGVVHRDLKPDNVMLVSRAEHADFVKVLDFGIAKVQGEDGTEQPALTKAGTVFGTPEYMAPEQAQGAVSDARTDLYTLGMMLYEMLSGATAFKDDQLVVVLTRQMTAEPPPLPDDVDPRVSRMVMKLLNKRPEERFQSAEELNACIDEILLGEARTMLQGPFDSTALNSSPAAAASSLRASLMSLHSSVRRVLDARLPGVVQTLNRTLQVGRLRARLWVLLVLLGVPLLVLVLLPSGSGLQSESTQGSVSAGAEETAEAQAPDLEPLMEKARHGDRAALSELRQLAPDSRESEPWLALGRGYAAIQHYEASLKAYEAATSLESGLAKDAKLLGDVRTIANQASHVQAALELAERLGPHGADLIYDVWESSKGDKALAFSAQLARAQLSKPTVAEQASPALRVALDLEQAKGCRAYKDVMARAAEHADSRSLAKLAPLARRSGCGFLGLRDCYGCLRGDANYTRALERAKSVPGPVYSSAPSDAASAEGRVTGKKSLSRAGRQ